MTTYADVVELVEAGAVTWRGTLGALVAANRHDEAAVAELDAMCTAGEREHLLELGAGGWSLVRVVPAARPFVAIEQAGSVVWAGDPSWLPFAAPEFAALAAVATTASASGPAEQAVDLAGKPAILRVLGRRQAGRGVA